MLLRALLVIGVLASATAALAQGAAVTLGPPAADPDAPVEVTADALAVDRESGTAIFTGNVLVVQGAMRLTARKVEVFYTEATDESPETEGGVREVVATGDVVFVNGEDAAEGQRAVFLPREDKVLVTGDVLLTQGRSIISGDRLVFDLATGEGTVEGRVRTVIRPDPSK